MRSRKRKNQSNFAKLGLLGGCVSGLAVLVAIAVFSEGEADETDRNGCGDIITAHVAAWTDDSWPRFDASQSAEMIFLHQEEYDALPDGGRIQCFRLSLSTIAPGKHGPLPASRLAIQHMINTKQVSSFGQGWKE